MMIGDDNNNSEKKSQDYHRPIVKSYGLMTHFFKN